MPVAEAPVVCSICGPIDIDTFAELNEHMRSESHRTMERLDGELDRAIHPSAYGNGE